MCGQSGHMLRTCPSIQGKGDNDGRSQSTTSAAPTCELTKQCNSCALQSHQDQEDSPDVVTSTYEYLISMFMLY